MKLLSIDPGLSTGYAVWDVYKSLVCFDSFTAEGSTIEEKLHSIFSSVNNLFEQFRFEAVVMEGVQYQFSLKSMTSTLRGNTFFLAYQVGIICGVCSSRRTNYIIKLPSEWKGQLTKEATRLRVLRALPELKKQKINNHTIDAIALGLSFQGRL